MITVLEHSTSHLPQRVVFCYIENFVSTLLNLSSNRMIAIY